MATVEERLATVEQKLEDTCEAFTLFRTNDFVHFQQDVKDQYKTLGSKINRLMITLIAGLLGVCGTLVVLVLTHVLGAK